MGVVAHRRAAEGRSVVFKYNAPRIMFADHEGVEPIASPALISDPVQCTIIDDLEDALDASMTRRREIVVYLATTSSARSLARPEVANRGGVGGTSVLEHY